jgi:gliding motility-associated-like protein
MRIFIRSAILFTAFFFFSPFVKAQQVSFEFDTVCQNVSTQLRAVTNIPLSDILSYSWDFGNNGTIDAIGKDIVYTKQVNNNVKLIIATASATFSSEKLVTFHTLPLSLFALPNSCESDTFLFDDYSFSPDGAISKYEWDFNGDGHTDSQVAGDVSFVFETHGTYTSTLNIESQYGCVSTFSQEVAVFDRPIADFNMLNHCIGDSTVFRNSSAYSMDSVKHMLWDFGDNYSINLITNEVSHQYKSAETFPVSLEIEYINGCKDKISKTITTTPSLELNLLFSTDTIIYRNKPVAVALADSYDSIYWSTGETLPEIKISDSGLYSVRVVKNECVHSTNFHIIKNDFLPPFEFESPVLSLNGDGINDLLVIKNITAFGNCNISIYNNRGQLIVSRKSFQNDWDMTINGALLETGGYFYVAETESGIFRGSFSVLR